jgi:hypothetical protein
MKIWKLSVQEIEQLADAADNALLNGRDLRVCVDGSGFKFKVGQDVWTPPLGVDGQG